MDTDTNLQSTDTPKTGTPATGEGKTDVSQSADLPKEEALTLDELNKIAGRTFTKKDDAVKHIEGLKKLVGDQEIASVREKAKQFDTLKGRYNTLIQAYAEENSMTIDEASKDIDKFLAGKTTETKTEPTSELAKEVAQLKSERARDKFISKHPEAEAFIEVVEAVAEKKGISFEEALLDSSLAKLVPKSGGTVTTEPNKRIGVSTEEVGALESAVKKGNAPFETKQAYIKALGLSK